MCWYSAGKSPGDENIVRDVQVRYVPATTAAK